MSKKSDTESMADIERLVGLCSAISGTTTPSQYFEGLTLDEIDRHLVDLVAYASEAAPRVDALPPFIKAATVARNAHYNEQRLAQLSSDLRELELRRSRG